MRRAFVKGAGYQWEFDVPGRGLLHAGTECLARQVGGWGGPCPWRRVRIVAKVDHIGSACNTGGAVYEIEDLGPGPAGKARDESGALFAPGPERTL